MQIYNKREIPLCKWRIIFSKYNFEEEVYFSKKNHPLCQQFFIREKTHNKDKTLYTINTRKMLAIQKMLALLKYCQSLMRIKSKKDVCCSIIIRITWKHYNLSIKQKIHKDRKWRFNEFSNIIENISYRIIKRLLQ